MSNIEHFCVNNSSSLKARKIISYPLKHSAPAGEGADHYWFLVGKPIACTLSLWCIGRTADMIFMYWLEIRLHSFLLLGQREKTSLERSRRKKSYLRNRVQSLPTSLRHSNWKWLLVFLKRDKIQRKMKAALEQRILPCTVYCLNLFINIQ